MQSGSSTRDRDRRDAARQASRHLRLEGVDVRTHRRKPIRLERLADEVLFPAAHVRYREVDSPTLHAVVSVSRQRGLGPGRVDSAAIAFLALGEPPDGFREAGLE